MSRYLRNTSPVPSCFKKDAVRICSIVKKDMDIFITQSQAVKLWERYSESSCASWLGLPDDDDELKNIIYYEINEYWDPS